MQGSHDQMNLNEQTIAYCLIWGLEIDIGVAKLSKEPEQPLIPPSGEVNADDTVDKSSSRTSVQLVTQLKAPTDRMTKKRRIPPSSKPKSPYKVKVILPKKQVTETQHAEVTMVTADATKSLASDLAEEQGNQPSTAEAEKLVISQRYEVNVIDEFNYLLKIDPDLFTYDIQWIKTYDEYEHELNNEKTQGLDEQWSNNEVSYQLGDHICETYRFKNGITKWPTCSSDTDGYCSGGELPGMVRVSRMTYFQDHKWYDKMIDGGLKQETLKYKAQIEESWGDATPGVMKFYAWLKNNFENFHELDYDVLVKLEECWLRVNTNEVCLFALWDDRLRGPYANAKPKWTFKPYLNVNRQPEWNNKTNNEENFQIGQKCMENLTHE
ncbi:hypothetical protein Tco_0434825, partial [Tanacetum coccineum]